MPNQSFIEERMELFPREVSGYSMNIIGGYDGESADIVFPIMVQQEDAIRFLRQSLELQRERIIEEIESKFYGANDVKVKDIIEIIKSI